MNKLNISSQLNHFRHLSNIQPIKNSLKSYSPSNIKHRNNEKFKNQQKKNLGSFKRINDKKNSNTPSPLLRRDKSEGSKDKKQDKSVSRYNNNSKKQFESCRLPKHRQHTQSVMEQTSTLRTQILNLKGLYEIILKQKSEIEVEQKKKGQELRKTVNQFQKYKKLSEKYKNRLICTEHQLQRIKKQCFKLLEIETFKNKKLQQTLQEKQLMIYYLRNQLGKENLGNNLQQNNIFLQSTTPIFKNEVDNHHRNQSKAYYSVNSIQSANISSQQKNKNVLSTSSYDQDKMKNNISQISQHQISLSKDKYQQMSQILESFILSPNHQSKLTKQQFKKYLLKQRSSQTYTQQSMAQPSYHTFQLKQQEKQVKLEQNAFKQNGFKKNKKNIQQNKLCQDKSQMSNQKQKKPRLIKSKRKSKKHLDDKESSSRSIDKKLGKYQFNFPATKVKKSKNSYR